MDRKRYGCGLPSPHTLSYKTNNSVLRYTNFEFSDTEMIVVGGKDTTVLATMEKYNSNGDLVETMTSMDIARLFSFISL